MTISALGCHGEPFHPDGAISKSNQETNPKSILHAEKLGVPVVIDFSGCTGNSDNLKYPNWVTSPSPPHYQEQLKWQSKKKAIPYWNKCEKIAAGHGVKIVIEMHPGFSVSNPETMLRLRNECGASIGCNYGRFIDSVAGRLASRWRCRSRRIRIRSRQTL